MKKCPLAPLKYLSSLLSAIIVLLGFNSCHTVRNVDNGNDKGVKLNPMDTDSVQVNEPVIAPPHDPRIREPQPVVYGPPPTEYKEMRKP